MARMLAPVLLVFLIAGAGCTSVTPKLEPMVRTELFFGLRTSSGTAIPPQAWQEFVRDTLVPGFPNGLTLVDSEGWWRASPQSVPVREPGVVAILLHPGQPSDHQAIERVRAAYVRRFEQQSVLRADQNVRAGF